MLNYCRPACGRLEIILSFACAAWSNELHRPCCLVELDQQRFSPPRLPKSYSSLARLWYLCVWAPMNAREHAWWDVSITFMNAHGRSSDRSCLPMNAHEMCDDSPWTPVNIHGRAWKIDVSWTTMRCFMSAHQTRVRYVTAWSWWFLGFHKITGTIIMHGWVLLIKHPIIIWSHDEFHGRSWKMPCEHSWNVSRMFMKLVIGSNERSWNISWAPMNAFIGVMGARETSRDRLWTPMNAHEMFHENKT